MPIEAAMSLLRGFITAEESVAGVAGEAAVAGGETAAGAGEAAAGGEPAAGSESGKGEYVKQDGGMKLKGSVPAKKDSAASKLKVPGSFALLLGFILLLVFAVSPAYAGASYTRLQLLLSVVLKGGSMRPESASGVQPLSGMPSNGTDGYDYHIGGLISSGSLYSEVG